MKEEIKRLIKGKRGKIGITLFLLGLATFLYGSKTLTGAVIGTSQAISKVWFSIGLSFILAGFFLMYFENKYYSPTKFRPLESILKEAGRDSIFVADTSGIIDYKPELRKLKSELKDGRLYIPKEVIKELKKNPSNERLVENYLLDEDIRRINPQGFKKMNKYDSYRKVRNLATSELEKTEKHKLYKGIRDILSNNMEKPKNMKEWDYTEYKNSIKKLDNKLSNEGVEPTNVNRLNEIKKHIRASRGDVEVLTNALMLAKYGEKVNVLARDNHLKEAIENITSKDRTLKPHLKYVQYSNKEDSYL